ncbi:MAG: HAD family hydrolase [Myxococcales bacterium]
MSIDVTYPSIAASTPQPRAARACVHCGSPLATAECEDFCCGGCRHVHELLSQSGLERYYVLRGDQVLAPVGEMSGSVPDAWLDAERARLLEQAPVARFTLDVQGLQCGACVWLIEAVFRRQLGALQINVNPALGVLQAAVATNFDLAAFVREVQSFGYRLGPARKGASSTNGGLRLRAGICLALAANTGFLSATAYFGLSSGPLYDLIRNASFSMATLSVLVGGSYFAERAWHGIKRGVLHLDFPIALGMGLAYMGSVWSLYFGGAAGNYLDTVSVFIALMLVGRMLQERLVERNRRQLLESDGASGLLARRVRGGQVELVPCTALHAGDQVLVCPGEVVPTTARLEQTRAIFSLAWINGESEPKAFEPGELVVAGAVNAGSSPLRATLTTGFERSDLDVLLKDDPTRTARASGDFWDRLARLYGALVLVTAGLGLLVSRLSGGSWPEALDVCTAVLVVTCPCAFGLATPLAYELGVAGLRRAGLFVRDATYFDRAAAVRRIVFDKTGTLTTGMLELEQQEPLANLSRAQRGVLYTLAAQSNHPKSTAISRALLALDPSLRLSEVQVHEEPGRGIECRIQGALFRLGARDWACPGAASGKHPSFSRDGIALAELPTVEVMRRDAQQEAVALSRAGYELWIASGDSEASVWRSADTLGIPREHARGNLSPTQKRDLVEKVGSAHTLMLGDGINDGLAFSAARCSGTPAVDRPFIPARSDFYFLNAGLGTVRLSLRVARAVRRVVVGALTFATLYNVAAVGIAYAGWMRPWLAAVLMPTSSICVLAYTSLALSRRSLWKS